MIDIADIVEAAPWRDSGTIERAAGAVAATLDRLDIAGPRAVAILYCDDNRIAALNGEFRGRPRPTNVLSWPSAERGAEVPGTRPAPPDEDELGDIAIAWETCAAEADAAGLTVADHAVHLIVHATLHLLGFDHETDADAALMEGLETEILGKLGLPDPYCRMGRDGPDAEQVT